MKAADANDDDSLNIADAIKILGYLFSGDDMIGADGEIITDVSCATYQEADVGALGCNTQCAE